MDMAGLMELDQKHDATRTMTKRRIADILGLIKEFQAHHAGKFPTTRSPFPRSRGSWNAIDGALRRDAIVQCQHFVQLKAALQNRGLTPSLARLDPSYKAPLAIKRRFGDILQVIEQSRSQHRGRFPLRSDTFDVRGYADTWIAIDSALATGAIVACPLWVAHSAKMARLGVKPSLASLNPTYRPLRRERRTISSIQAAIVSYMVEYAGKLPNQRAPFPSEVPPDSWKAICKSLCSHTIEHDANWIDFKARLELSKEKPSLFTFLECYRHELQRMYVSVQPFEVRGGIISSRVPKAKPVGKKPVQFGAVIAQLFWAPVDAGAKVDFSASNVRLAKSLMRD